jgi:hypothetical protein
VLFAVESTHTIAWVFQQVSFEFKRSVGETFRVLEVLTRVYFRRVASPEFSRPFKGSDILDSALLSNVEATRCNGSATLMRGKSQTCRDVAHYSERSLTVAGRRPGSKEGSPPASRRLAAHQSGRAIAKVASSFRGVRAGSSMSCPFQGRDRGATGFVA